MWLMKPAVFEYSYWVLVAAFLALLGFAQSVPALTVVAKIEPPYFSRKMPQEGLSAAIISAALKRSGYTATFSFETWPRAYEGAQLGVYDIVGSIWYTEERNKGFAFSNAYLFHEIKFIKRKADKEISFRKLDDLDGLLVGTLKDYAYRAEFLNSKKFIRLPENHLLQNLLKLSQGQIDLTLAEAHKIRYEINEYMRGSAKDLEILPEPLMRRGTHIAVSRLNLKHKQIIEGFNKAIKSMKQDGSYEKILADFGY